MAPLWLAKCLHPRFNESEMYSEKSMNLGLPYILGGLIASAPNWAGQTPFAPTNLPVWGTVQNFV